MNKREFDEKVTWVMKYGILGGLIIAAIIFLLEALTGFTGEIAKYSIVVLSVVGYTIAIVYVIKVLIQLRRMGKI